MSSKISASKHQPAMTGIRLQAAHAGDLPGLADWLAGTDNQALPTRQPRLKSLQVDGCLLVARDLASSRHALKGLVGLDPGTGRISLLACRPLALAPQLLEAAERLAVGFGMQELQLRINPCRHSSLHIPEQWQELAEPGLLQRKLSRRLTRFARQALQINARLGVPADYGRKHRLRLQTEPAELSSIGVDVFDREQFMTPLAAKALLTMIRQAAAEGIAIQAVSAFRSVSYQNTLLQNKLDRGQDMADILRVSAAPGYSEHHSGRAIDLTTPGFNPLEEEFADSDAFAWLKRHAAGFGFRLSFPPGNRHSVAYEPWHWYYLGRK